MNYVKPKNREDKKEISVVGGGPAGGQAALRARDKT